MNRNVVIAPKILTNFGGLLPIKKMFFVINIFVSPLQNRHLIPDINIYFLTFRYLNIYFFYLLKTILCLKY